MREGKEPCAHRSNRRHGGGARRVHDKRDDRAPERAEERGLAAAFSNTVLSAAPASALSPSIITAIVKKEQVEAADD